LKLFQYASLYSIRSSRPVIFMVKRYYFICLLLLSCLNTICQDSVVVAKDSVCQQKDLPEVVREWRSKPTLVNPVKTGSILIVPSIGSNPATGVSFGAAGQYAFRLKEKGSL